jgi:hypothetical protein
MTDDAVSGPGALATDKRVPELGMDLNILRQSNISLGDGIAQVTRDQGPVIEAKFELDDSGKLSLSIYPAGQSLDTDAERNKFQEFSGDPSAKPWTGSLEVFQDQEHLTRSARDLTLIQLSAIGVADVAGSVDEDELAFWTIPTIRRGRAGFGVYTFDGRRQHYRFVDGRGSNEQTRFDPEDLGDGPGDGATDQRKPELGSDLSILKSSKISMAQALAQVSAQYSALIEAKFELDDSGKLSLSIYPAGDGLDVDSERNHFFELSGDPTANAFAPSLAEFTVPDVEHLTRSSRDLTLVQTAGLSLREAVDVAQSAIPDGFVFWVIPTIRDTRSGYGVYVYGSDGSVHYFFIS